VADDDGPEDEGPDDNVTFLDAARPPKGRGSKQTAKNAEKDHKRKLIPQLPPPNVDVNDIDMRGEVTTLDEAVVNMRIAGAGFHDIAVTLGLPSAVDAQQRLYRALAKTHPREDWETTRALEVARVEQLVSRSMQMAGADFLVDPETNERVPNEDRLKWHAQAAQDIALHATITGAKAATRVEITPTDQEFEQIVDLVLAEKGIRRDHEVNILELEDIEDAEIVEDEEDERQ
jgi:hypothetical protein